MYFLASTLDSPDDPAWCHDYGYSHTIAEALTNAYRLIKRGAGSTASFLRAATLILPHLKARMSNRQRLHLYYLLACAYAADTCYTEALEWVDRALMLALRLEAVATQIELLTLRAVLHRAALLFEEALSDRLECLALLDTQYEVSGIDDVASRLHTLSHLAGAAFYMEQYDLAECTIWEVRALAPRVPDSQFDAAGAEWVQAHLYRSRGQPERTIHHMLATQESYLQDANLTSQGRFEYFVAQTALEWAESLPSGSDRQAIITLASPHLRRAEQLAKEAHDYPGQALARLAHVHYSRLRNSNLDRITLLETVIRQGRSLDDIAIQAQALVALGNELTLEGSRESGLNLYRQVVQMLDGSQVPVLARPARRALRFDEEMHVD